MIEKLTPEDHRDRKAWETAFEIMNRKKVEGVTRPEDYENAVSLYDIMKKQGMVGETQEVDYDDTLWYEKNLETFKAQEFPEGDIVEHYDDIIFDFDGVLYDSTNAVYYGLILALEHFAPNNPEAKLTMEEAGNTYHAPFQDYYRRFGIDLNDPQTRDAFHKYYMDVCYKAGQEKYPEHFYPDAVEALKKLKEEKIKNPNLRIHIVSAKKEIPGMKLLQEAGLTEFLDDIHFDAHDKKEAIAQIVAKSGNPKKCIMVGDLPSDIKDAHANAGIRSIGVARGDREHERLGHYLPSYVIRSLFDSTGQTSDLFNLKSYAKELKEI